MESKKKTIMQGVICAVLLCVIWGGYFFIKTYYTGRILDIREDDFSWVYQVDSVKTEGKDFVLQGFAFELDKNAEEGAFEIVLEDIESGKRYFPKMEYMERKDVNEYFLCEYDYLQSGFEATIDANRIDVDKNNYEVLLRVDGERMTYRTGVCILEGDLSLVQGMANQENVSEDEFRQAVNEGKLLYSSDEQGMYVYQYKGGLYWLIEEKYKKSESYYNRIVLCLWTTQKNKLPTTILEKGGTRDEIHVYFDDENKIDNCYYTCKIELPTSYSITRMLVGNYNNSQWAWNKTLRPFYEFE